MRQGPGGSRSGVRNRRGRLGTLAKVPSAVCMEPVGACTPMPGNLKVQAETGQGLEGSMVFKVGELRAADHSSYHHFLLTDSWKSQSGKGRRPRSKRGTLPAPRKGCCRGRKPPSLEVHRGCHGQKGAVVAPCKLESRRF